MATNNINAKTTIYICCKHPLVLQVLQNLLGSAARYAIEEVRPVKLSLGQEAVQRVLLIDALSVQSWPEHVPKGHNPSEPIILLQAPHLRILTEELQALLLGVSGIVYMSASMKEELLDAIDCVLQGRFWINPDALAEYVKRADRSLKVFSPGGLTLREEQILSLLSKGFVNRKIASALDISVRTVKFHISNILNKRNVKNRRELMNGQRSVTPAGTNHSETFRAKVA